MIFFALLTMTTISQLHLGPWIDNLYKYLLSPHLFIPHSQQQHQQTTATLATQSNSPSISQVLPLKPTNNTTSHVSLQVQQEQDLLRCLDPSPDPSLLSRCPAPCSSQDDPRPGP
ncbi:hypothetical protein F5H01DRAFT_342819 [Linnemannia elongata]|nr:hypothetical protein F5H01DRAFT_342819 [Linnemannia elongata]